MFFLTLLSISKGMLYFFICFFCRLLLVWFVAWEPATPTSANLHYRKKSMFSCYKFQWKTSLLLLLKFVPGVISSSSAYISYLRGDVNSFELILNSESSSANPLYIQFNLIKCKKNFIFFFFSLLGVRQSRQMGFYHR